MKGYMQEKCMNIRHKWEKLGILSINFWVFFAYSRQVSTCISCLFVVIFNQGTMKLQIPVKKGRRPAIAKDMQKY